MTEKTPLLGHTHIFGSRGAGKSAPALLKLLHSGDPAGVLSVAQAKVAGSENRTIKIVQQNSSPYYRAYRKREWSGK